MRTRIEGTRARRARKRGRVLLGILKGFVLTVLGVALGIVIAIWYFGRDLPDVSLLRDYRPIQTTRIVDRRGTLLAEVFEERRTVVPFRAIPQHVLKAVLAAEDADFYEHRGLDYPGMLRALLVNLREGEFRQGGSTITQQVVKNFLLTSERSLSRKIKEVLLARRLEQHLSKDEILHLWLNQVNFGDGRYGIEEAARYYFGKGVARVTVAEAAMLAGIPKAPSHYSPRQRPAAARRRQLFVIGEMERRHLVAPAVAAAARTEPLRIAPVRADSLGVAPEVVSIAQHTLRDLVGGEAARKGGYVVHTTIDVALERAARAALQKGLRAVDERQQLRPGIQVRGKRRPLPLSKTTPRVGHMAVAEVTRVHDASRSVEVKVAGVRGVIDLAHETRYVAHDAVPSKLLRSGERVRVAVLESASGEQPARMRLAQGPEGAIVLLDVRTRELLALVGGYDAMPLGFDRASTAHRQPGSAFKPIVYGAAIGSRRFTPATILYDAPEVYDQWRPQNFETWRHQGPVRLREALAESINVAAVRLLSDVGIEPTIAFAKALGIQSAMEPTLALALGAADLTPLELAGAYAVFAGGGERWTPPLVTRIEGPDHRAIELPPAPARERVMGQDEAYLLTSLLTSVVDHGTGRAARRLARPAAGKTGTSNEARDAWFVGYTPDLVACVWVGFDDRTPLGPGESGAKTALPIWIELMAVALDGRPASDFPVPSGIVTARIDPASGLLAYEGQTDTLTESFLDGTVPTDTARPPDVMDPARFLVDSTGATPPPAPPPAPASPEPAPAPPPQ